MSENQENSYKKVGSLWYRNKHHDNGTVQKYLAGQVEFLVDGKLVTANVTIFGNRGKIHDKMPDCFLYMERVNKEPDSEIDLDYKDDIPF